MPDPTEPDSSPPTDGSVPEREGGSVPEREDGSVPEREDGSVPEPEDRGKDEVPPMLPSRGAFLLAFAGVVVAGLFGGVIGFGIADVGSHSDTSRVVGTFVGSIAGAGGVAIVAVLMLRAMSEWHRSR